MISARRTSARSGAIRLALVLAGSALLALSAQIVVPMVPVPATLQTLALPLLVLALGRDLATVATLTYLLEGALGAPVFSAFHGGAGWLVGPTAGFLWTFPIAAYLTGTLLETRLGRSYPGRWAAIALGTGVVFVGGAGWLGFVLSLSPAVAFAKAVLPFLIGDACKVTIAAGLASQGTRLAARLGL